MGTASVEFWFDWFIKLVIILCVLLSLFRLRKWDPKNASWKTASPLSFVCGILMIIHFAMQFQKEALLATTATVAPIDFPIRIYGNLFLCVGLTASLVHAYYMTWKEAIKVSRNENSPQNPLS